jgi:Fe-S cluster assembly protein SufD
MIDQVKKRFKTFEAGLNGAGEGKWHQQRLEALNAFMTSGLPGAKDEEYRYTQMGRMLKKNFDFSLVTELPERNYSKTQRDFHDAEAYHLYITNGVVDFDLSDEVEDKGFVIAPLKKAVKSHANEVHAALGNYAHASSDAFAALNMAFSLHGFFIKVPKNTSLKKPVIIHHTASTGPAASMANTRNLILVGQSAKAQIVESYDSVSSEPTFSNHVTEVVVAANANLDYFKIQNQNNSTYHIDNTCIAQKRDSKVQAFTFSLDGKTVRNNLRFLLQEENIEAHMLGLYVAHGDTLIDNHTTVDHQVANCFSNEIYKGILDDKAKGVFNGKIFVQQDAQKTNAFQTNKNILLSDTATINTKPQLEIWADDVSCSHGCTTGQLDEEQLFYLQSRGISKSKATAMLLHAFVNDILNKIDLDFLKEFLQGEMDKRLD